MPTGEISEVLGDLILTKGRYSSSAVSSAALLTSISSSMRQEFYKGVYGIIATQDSIVTIRKKRGPYCGMLDLPGGGISKGEGYEQALSREVVEELGITVNNFSFIGKQTNVIAYEAKIFSHEAYLYFINSFGSDSNNFICLDQEEGTEIVLLDVYGACKEEVSFIAKEGLRYIISHNKANKSKRIICF